MQASILNRKHSNKQCPELFNDVNVWLGPVKRQTSLFMQVNLPQMFTKSEMTSGAEKMIAKPLAV